MLSSASLSLILWSFKHVKEGKASCQDVVTSSGTRGLRAKKKKIALLKSSVWQFSVLSSVRCMFIILATDQLSVIENPLVWTMFNYVCEVFNIEIRKCMDPRVSAWGQLSLSLLHQWRSRASMVIRPPKKITRFQFVSQQMTFPLFIKHSFLIYPSFFVPLFMMDVCKKFYKVSAHIYRKKK